MSQKIQKNRENSGSVIFWILIAVALFGALSFAFTQMSGSGANFLGRESTNAAATQIVQYASDLRQTVQRLKLRGCADTDISFENTLVSGYENVNSPPDKCKIFDSMGGGLAYSIPQTTWLDSVAGPPDRYGEWYFPRGVCVANVGTGADCSQNSYKDILVIIPYIRREICLEINDILGVTNPGGDPPNDTASAWNAGSPKFDGSWTGATLLSNDLDGVSRACFEGTDGASLPTSGTYHYYQVLQAR